MNRDLGYVATFLEQDDVFLKPKQAERLAVILRQKAAQWMPQTDAGTRQNSNKELRIEK